MGDGLKAGQAEGEKTGHEASAMTFKTRAEVIGQGLPLKANSERDGTGREKGQRELVSFNTYVLKEKDG